MDITRPPYAHPTPTTPPADHHHHSPPLTHPHCTLSYQINNSRQPIYRAANQFVSIKCSGTSYLCGAAPQFLNANGKRDRTLWISRRQCSKPVGTHFKRRTGCYLGTLLYRSDKLDDWGAYCCIDSWTSQGLLGSKEYLVASLSKWPTTAIHGLNLGITSGPVSTSRWSALPTII